MWVCWDRYSRPGSKRGGAWMDVCLGRSAVLAPEGEVRAGFRAECEAPVCVRGMTWLCDAS